MDNRNINLLLDRYFEGQTTLEEEARLRAYFTGPNVEPELELYRPLFAGQIKMRRAAPPADFEDTFWKEARHRSKPPRRLGLWAAAVAASILLTLSGWWWAWSIPSSADVQASIDWSQYEVQSPEVAYLITRGALERASDELNSSAKRTAREVEHLKLVTEFINGKKSNHE